MLRILEATEADRDSYVCTASNAAGSARGVAVIDIGSECQVSVFDSYQQVRSGRVIGKLLPCTRCKFSLTTSVYAVIRYSIIGQFLF